MKFHGWKTFPDELKEFDKKYRKMDWNDLFLKEFETISNAEFRDPSFKEKRLVRLLNENIWHNDGRPYYNIHPNIVNALINTKLDNIPASLIEMPHNLTTVNLRFAYDVPIFLVEERGHLIKDPKIEQYPIYCRSVLMNMTRIGKDVALTKIQETIENPENAKYMQKMIAEDNMIISVSVDVGARTKENGILQTLTNMYWFIAQSNETIPEAIERHINDLNDEMDKMVYTHHKQMLINLFKVIVSCGFLVNSPTDDIVTPDLITADRQKYQIAKERNDTATMQALCERAKRKGLGGYNIGTNELFVGDADYTPQNDKEKEGKELKYSHLRSGHFHPVRYGEGKKKVKLKWFRPVRVRPDLPFKADS